MFQSINAFLRGLGHPEIIIRIGPLRVIKQDFLRSFHSRQIKNNLLIFLWDTYFRPALFVGGGVIHIAQLLYVRNGEQFHI
jgi:hypothetical protein